MSISNELKKAIHREEEAKINDFSTWQIFADKVIDHRTKTINFFNEFRDKKIIGFGSSARSQTYLNYCGASTENIESIIDNNSLKHNYFTPGTSIPIVSFNTGINSNPDIIFILAWNFKEEIIQECRNKGFKGDFFIPFPNSPYFNE